MLTVKQERFVQELVKGKSQREAYKTAYPGSEKWKVESIDNKASKIFNKAEVKTRYEELLKETSKEIVHDVAAIKNEMIDILLTMMRANAGDQADDISHVDGIAVKGYKYDTRGNLQYEFYDKIQAMTKLSELLGLNEEQTETVQVILGKAEGYDV